MARIFLSTGSSRKLQSFNSLQTGKGIASHHHHRFSVGRNCLVSIPFKRERGSQDSVTEPQNLRRVSFNSLQTGKRIASKPSSGKTLEMKNYRFNSLQTGKGIARCKARSKACTGVRFRFNSLQTGKGIARMNKHLDVSKLGLPFQFPSNGKGDRKSQTHENRESEVEGVSIPFKRERVWQAAYLLQATGMRLTCFNSLQTGKCMARQSKSAAGTPLIGFVSIPFKRESVFKASPIVCFLLECYLFQFPSNGKGYRKPTAMVSNSMILSAFQFPSNGKVDRKTAGLGKMSRTKISFNSLQTGKWIASKISPRRIPSKIIVSIPFKRESVSQEPVAEHILDVGVEFQFPSNGKGDRKLLL